MQKKIRYLITVLLITFLLSCSTRHAVEMEPVEIKPIHITIDVNIKVDKALDDFFDDIDEADDETSGSSDTQN